MEKNWIKEMIELEATPRAIRQEGIGDFCKRLGVNESTYKYQRSKKENQEQILEIVLNKAKSECPEVLSVLVDKAKSGDMKAMDIYIDSILKLAKNLDIKTDGKPIIQAANEILQKHGINPSTSDNSQGQA